MIMQRKSFILAITSGMLLTSGGAGLAQVRVDGKPEMIHVEASDATVQEILAALHDKFKLRYRSDDALETRKTGVFDGPLQRVTGRILERYDFAIKITSQGIDVLVLRQKQPGKTAVEAVSAVAVRPPMTATEVKHFASEHFR